MGDFFKRRLVFTCGIVSDTNVFSAVLDVCPEYGEVTHPHVGPPALLNQEQSGSNVAEKEGKTRVNLNREREREIFLVHILLTHERQFPTQFDIFRRSGAKGCFRPQVPCTTPAYTAQLLTLHQFHSIPEMWFNPVCPYFVSALFVPRYFSKYLCP